MQPVMNEAELNEYLNALIENAKRIIEKYADEGHANFRMLNEVANGKKKMDDVRFVDATVELTKIEHSFMQTMIDELQKHNRYDDALLFIESDIQKPNKGGKKRSNKHSKKHSKKNRCLCVLHNVHIVHIVF